MTTEEMQAAQLRVVNELNQRLADLEQRERERQERYDKMEAEDRVRRLDEYKKHDARATEALELHRRSVTAAEDLNAAVWEWLRDWRTRG